MSMMSTAATWNRLQLAWKNHSTFCKLQLATNQQPYSFLFSPPFIFVVIVDVVFSVVVVDVVQINQNPKKKLKIKYKIVVEAKNENQICTDATQEWQKQKRQRRRQQWCTQFSRFTCLNIYRSEIK